MGAIESNVLLHIYSTASYSTLLRISFDSPLYKIKKICINYTFYNQ